MPSRMVNKTGNVGPMLGSRPVVFEDFAFDFVVFTMSYNLESGTFKAKVGTADARKA